MSARQRRVGASLARVVAVPDTWPAAQRRRGQAVLGLATGLAAVAVPSAILVALLLPDPAMNVMLIVAALPAYLFLRRLVADGRVTAGAWLLISFFLVVPVVGSTVLGEARASVFFPVVGVVIAGAVLRPRGALVAVALSFAVVLGLPAVVGVAHSYTGTEAVGYLALSLMLAGAAAAAGAVVADLAFTAADAARHEATSLADELRAANAGLEERVQRRTDQLSAALQRERRLSNTLAELTVHDPLTGLYNRRHMDDELIRLFAYALRSGDPLSAAVIDLDDFKSVNDHYSHVTGDDVLRAAADVLAANTRTSDVLVRMGGEEFALLMPGTTTVDAVRVCERMRLDLAAHDWDALQPGLQVTASFGVATSTGLETGAALLRTADERMFDAKRQGKNRVVEVSAV
jgi:diguanylate cyclase (GGDEF)-like protein